MPFNAKMSCHTKMPYRCRNPIFKVVTPLAMLMLVSGLLAGCSTGEIADKLSAPKLTLPRAEDFTPFSGVKTAPLPKQRKLTPADYMGPDGSCPPPAADSPPSGVTLGMPECDLVHVLGAPERVEVGSDERGRSVVAIYSQGPRPGLYRFSEGRLRSIERVGPAEAKPKRPPTRRRATRTSQ